MRPADMIEVPDMPAMRRTLRRLFRRSPMSAATIEQIAGLPSGYVSKALASRPLRGLSGNTIFLLTTVLGRKIVLLPDPKAVARVKAHRDYVVSTVNQKRFGVRHANRLSMLRKLGQLGGAARLEKMTPAERSRVARIAARARWRKEKRRNREAAPLQSANAIPAGACPSARTHAANTSSATSPPAPAPSACPRQSA